MSVCQVEIHPYWRQERLVSFCRQNNIHVTAYSPLAGREGIILDRPPFISPTRIRSVSRLDTTLLQALSSHKTKDTCLTLFHTSHSTQPKSLSDRKTVRVRRLHIPVPSGYVAGDRAKNNDENNQ